MKNLRPRWTIVLALLAPASLALGAEPLGEVDQHAREWVKLRLEANRLDTAWRGERELVESTVAALKERATLLEEKRDLTKAKTAKDREGLETMRAKNRAAAEDLKACEARLAALTTRLLALRPALPPRLADALSMSYRSLEDQALPLGERLQLAINVLNRCAQFNRLVTAGEDVLTLDGASAPKSLETIYWGLSHGYAVDRGARKAWLGSPAGGNWRWEPQPDAFDRVLHLIAVAHDKSDPALVAVPVGATKSATAITRN
jgi:hypothetical protein